MKKQYDISKLKRAEPKYMKHLKSSITIRINPHVIDYFKTLADKIGIPYQSLINYVLKDYAASNLEPSANWHRSPTTKKKAA